MNARKNAPRQQSKSLTAYIATLRRETNLRKPAERFLIVCEDTKSSPNYFKKLRKKLNLQTASVQVAESGGCTQPSQVVDRAIEIREQEKKSGDPFDQVWTIVDGDFGDKVAVARQKAKANSIKLTITTPCFEYWILLHFEDYRRTQNNSDQMIAQLKTHWPDYDKGTADFSSIIAQHTAAADRARDGRKLRNHDTLPENHNPCSEIFLLIDAINKSIESRG